MQHAMLGTIIPDGRPAAFQDASTCLNPQLDRSFAFRAPPGMLRPRVILRMIFLGARFPWDLACAHQHHSKFALLCPRLGVFRVGPV